MFLLLIIVTDLFWQFTIDTCVSLLLTPVLLLAILAVVHLEGLLVSVGDLLEAHAHILPRPLGLRPPEGGGGGSAVRAGHAHRAGHHLRALAL